MFRRAVMISAVGLGLAGCAGQMSGVYYADTLQRMGPPKAGHSRVVVFQEKPSGVSLEATACDVKLDGAMMGKLPVGTYVVADRPAGRHQLTVTENLFPGDTTRDVTLEAGRTHFFVSRASKRRNVLMASGVTTGLAGMLVASAVTSNSDNAGPVDLIPVDEASARRAIADLQLAQ